MNLPDRLDVAEMTKSQAEQVLVKILSTYPMDRPLSKLDPMTPVDQIANAVLYLEDHIQSLMQADIARAANQARWGNDQAIEVL
jgi:hypothetical protein